MHHPQSKPTTRSNAPAGHGDRQGEKGDASPAFVICDPYTESRVTGVPFKTFRSRIAGRCVLKSERAHPWIELVEAVQEQEDLRRADAVIAALHHSPHQHILFQATLVQVNDPDSGIRRQATPKEQAAFIRHELSKRINCTPALKPDHIKCLKNTATALESPTKSKPDPVRLWTTGVVMQRLRLEPGKEHTVERMLAMRKAPRTDATIIEICETCKGYRQREIAAELKEYIRTNPQKQ
jgi:hypothetical protein